MKIDQIVELLNGELLTDNKVFKKEIAGAMGADLMSDVLASILPLSLIHISEPTRPY